MARVLHALTAFGNSIGTAAEAEAIGRAMHEGIASLLHGARLELRIPSPSREMLNLVYPATDAAGDASGGDRPRSVAFPGATPEALCAARHCEVDPEPGRSCMPMQAGGLLFGVASVTVSGGLGEANREILRAFCVYGAIGLATQDAQRTANLLRDAIDRSDEAVSFYDASGRILFTNPAYHRIFAHYPPPERLLRMTHEELYRLDLDQGVIDDPLAQADPQQYLAERMRLFSELRGEAREVQTIEGRTYLYVRTRAAGGATLSRRVDITDMKAAETELRAAQERLRDLAFTDALTGLANRLGFGAQAALAQRPDQAASVLLINLDRFKAINDTLGHATGDALLRAMAKRLQGCLLPSDLAARLGADEFAVLLPGCPGVQAAGAARRVVQALNAPYWIDDRRIVVSASVGISSAPDDGDSAEALLRNADRALDRAKAEGRATHRRFESSMDTALQERRAIGLELPEAMAAGQFELYYQPVVELAGGTVSGLEALLRWNHPKRGLVSPSLFIPVAEDIGQMDALGEWVLRQACAEARHWPAHLNIAVNISPRQLASAGLVAMVEAAMEAGGLAADRLEVEVTESIRLQGNPAVLSNLHHLRDLGVRIALDDFGTGYSSLSYLCSFPFTKIKIDQSFVKGIADRADCAAIVSVAAELGSRLGMTTTAEGVETADQLVRVRAAGCDEAQGYLIAPPRPLADAREWLASSRGGRVRA